MKVFFRRMLLDYLEQIRQQPKEVRRRFAFTWSLIITGVIVAIWISVLFGRSYALREPELSVEEVLEQQAQDIRESFNSANSFTSDNSSFEDPIVPPTDSPQDASSTEQMVPGAEPEVASATEAVFDERGQIEDVETTPEP